MNYIDFEPGDDYEKQCGELFLSIKGNIIIHCTLCENKYAGFDEYAAHIATAHCSFGKLSPKYETSDDEANDYDSQNVSDVFKQESCSTPSCNESIADVLEECEVELVALKKKVPRKIVRREVKQDLKQSVVLKKKPKRLAVRSKRKRCADSRIYKCTHCDFACNDKSNLTSHIRRHSQNRPHQCAECSKSFYTRTELKAHCRSHTGERPFLCMHCGRAFKTSGILSDHVKRHTNTRDKECLVCNKKFYNNDQLQKHMAVHSADRPYKCVHDSCDASFKQRNALNSHLKIHENKREYQCELCPARFNQNPGLHSHMKSKHAINCSSSI